jgi:hypothetical protein
MVLELVVDDVVEIRVEDVVELELDEDVESVSLVELVDRCTDEVDWVVVPCP